MKNKLLIKFREQNNILLKIKYQNIITTHTEWFNERSLSKHYKHTIIVKEREMKILDQAMANLG